MSPSTRSKAESPPSPATGDGDKAAADGAPDDGAKPARPHGPVVVELEVSRQHVAGWTLFGLVFGALLVWKLGTVGQWVGVVLMTVGAFNLWELVQTFRHPPGTIVVDAQRVVLPRGLCMSRPVELTPADVTAVYFLRRSVPWNRSAPVLIVEVGTRAMAFPRDWFASEADQRHVVHALMRGLGKEATGAAIDAPSSGAPKVVLDDSGKLAVAQMVGGLVLIAVGILGSLFGRSQSGAYVIYVGPMVAGVIIAWRGFARW